MRHFWMSLGLVALLALVAQAQDFLDQPGAKSEATLRLEQVTARPGDTVWAGLHLVIPAPWHTYWVNGTGGMAPSVKWQLPRGVTAGKIHWPLPKKQKSFGSIAYVYERESLLLVPLKLAKDLKPGQREVKAVFNWLECSEESCVPGEKHVTAKFEVGAARVAGGDAALFTKWRAQLPGVMPDLKADWVGPVADNFWRPLAFRVPLKDADDKVEFFPYLDPKDEFTVHADVEVEWGKSFVKLTQQVESVGKMWPAQVSGVLRVGDKSYEVVLKVGKPDNTSEFPGAKTKVTLLLDANEARSGQIIYAGVRFKIPEKWHIFWKYPGELGKAPKIHWQLPSGVTAGEIRWPKHEKYEAFGVKQNIYEEEVMLLVPLHLDDDLQPGEKKISAKVTWQECEVSCVLGDATVHASLKIGATHQPSIHAAAIADWRDKVPGFSESLGQLTWILLLAFGGGLILNLMPCVLPVIALKVMGFVNQRKEEPGHARRLGIIYGLGVIFSFLIMAGLLLSVRAGAGGETWGMQMQNQWFLLFLAGLMTLVALNLFGVFEISLGGRTMTAADSVARREGDAGAFANGILMVALATPCMAPMLGTAIPFALTQPAMVTLLVFATVAVGLALPYVALSFKPNWLRFLPQPGAWMESFKKAMGFPMLAAAVWLMMLTGNHFAREVDKGEGMLRVALMLAMLAMAAWIFGEFIQRGTRQRALAGVLAVACVGVGFGCLYMFKDKLDWQPWSKQAVVDARAAGHPVLVDFTADWCLTCKMNKRRSIEVDAVRKKIAETGAVVFKADFTRKNPVMADYIKSHGRAGVPLVLVYSPRPDENPQILPEDLTLTSGPSLVISALDKAAASLEEARKPEEILSPNPGPKKPSVQPVETNQTTEGNQTRKPGDGRSKLPLSENAIVWTPWSREAIAGARSKGKPVLVDFTADWCAPCKYIEKTAINIPKVREKLAGIGAVTLKADFTNKDPVVLREMQRFGRAGPPLVLVYPPGENREPVVMAKVFTAEDMLKALDQAVEAKGKSQKGLESAEASATPRR